jgi:cobyrinic acid a,c-diamide synthase
MHAVVIAGTHSGVGKTTVTLGLLAALRRRGLKVQAFKVGPDFIDPGHHTTITGSASRTLDGWMLSRTYNEQTFWYAIQDQDIGIIEGMMGLFDGVSGTTEVGSTAEMAKWLDLPVILVVDASAMARSVAALVHGFRSFDPQLRVMGVIFNRIGGRGHLQYLRDAMATLSGLTVLGGLPQTDTLTMEERHLGLVTADERRLTSDHIAQLATMVEEHIDLSQLLHLSPTAANIGIQTSEDFPPMAPGGKPRVRLGVARDEAFCFYYPDNLALLERAGAELIFFSPVHDSQLPPNLQGLYLGGGYPEVHAHALAANSAMRIAVRTFVEQDGLVYAECGGLMYLTRGLREADGRVLPLVGIYPTSVRMLPHLKALGYVEVTSDTPTGPFLSGSARGHMFHYSELEEETCWNSTIIPLYRVQQRASTNLQRVGYRYKQCMASYVHLHFGSNPTWAANLVAAAGRHPR